MVERFIFFYFCIKNVLSTCDQSSSNCQNSNYNDYSWNLSSTAEIIISVAVFIVIVMLVIISAILIWKEHKNQRRTTHPETLYSNYPLPPREALSGYTCPECRKDLFKCTCFGGLVNPVGAVENLAPLPSYDQLQKIRPPPEYVPQKEGDIV